MRAVILLAILTPALLPAQDDAPGQPPPAHVVRTALQWMESTDPDRREAAYRSVQLLGKEALPAFESALRQASRHHQARLKDLLADRGNPYRELGPLVGELETERERVYALIQTDYQKDPDKVAMLRGEIESIGKTYERAARLAGTDPSVLDAAVDAIAAILVELQDQLARFEDVTSDESSVPLEDRKRLALGDSYEGDSYLTHRKQFAAMKLELAGLAAANNANKACRWANGSQLAFAELLNQERAIMGLTPLRLEEKLSDAATGHSSDMKSEGFFSHTSPIDGKHSPNDRAKKAGFQGQWTGENIFMGSSSHTSAYNGWFASDGHRFIMFARVPNVIGLGPVGGHWTLMTGRI